MEKILVINPGSTSTKIAVYENETQLFVNSIEHSSEEIEKYDAIYDQFEFRKELVLNELKEHDVKPEELTCVVARGGLLPPVSAGAIRVNQDMCDQLRLHPVNEHASNLGAPIAFSIAKPMNIPAFIYDPITVDEMQPLALFTGVPEMRRKSLGHHLNMRAMAHKYAKENGKKLEDGVTYATRSKIVETIRRKNVHYTDDDTIPRGYKVVTVERRDGYKTEAYQDKYVNGVLEGSKLLYTDTYNGNDEEARRGTASPKYYKPPEDAVKID